MLSFIPDAIKIPAIGVVGLVVGAGLMFLPAKWIGATGERQVIAAQAAKEALNRIQNLEKNNAAFKTLPARERCLVFMRDSGLPESSCVDER
jgi:hypothetical protein